MAAYDVRSKTYKLISATACAQRPFTPLHESLTRRHRSLICSNKHFLANAVERRKASLSGCATLMPSGQNSGQLSKSTANDRRERASPAPPNVMASAAKPSVQPGEQDQDRVAKSTASECRGVKPNLFTLIDIARI